MGVIQRQGVKSTLISYLGIALGAVNVLAVYPAMLAPEEIGLIRLLIDISILISTIALLGIPGSITKYFSYFSSDKKGLTEFLSLCIYASLMVFSITALLLYQFNDLILSSFKEKSSLLFEYKNYLYAFILIFILQDIFTAISKSYFRITIPKFLSDVFIRVGIVILITTYFWQKYSLDKFISIYLCIYLASLIILIVYTYRLSTELKLVASFSSIYNNPLLPESIKFSLFLALGAISSTIIIKIDTWMVSSILGLKTTGIYVIAAYIGTVIEIPRKAINLISYPVIAKHWQQNQINKIKEIYQKTSITPSITGFLFFTLIWINIDDLFNMIPNGHIYKAGKYVVLFIGLSKLIDTLMGANAEILITSKYYKYHLIFGLFLASLSVITNYLFIPTWGISGAAIASFISILIVNFMRYWVIKQKLGLHPMTFKTLQLLLIAIPIFFLSLILPNFEFPIVNIVYKSILVGILYISLVYFFKISEDVNSLIKRIIY